jgi:hypothetical protein
MKTTTKKKVVRSKTKTNFDKNLEAEIEQALENAKQIKSWNKYGSTDFSYIYVFMAGIILGLAIACIVVTPSIIEAIG